MACLEIAAGSVNTPSYRAVKMAEAATRAANDRVIARYCNARREERDVTFEVHAARL